ncbi:RNA polymerase sigma factor [Rhodococcus sp. NPDC055112]
MGADEVRFTEMYTRLYVRVRSYAGRRAPESVAQEATDETFLIAWKKLCQLPHDPLPWLLVTARNVLSEHQRRDGRQDALVARMLPRMSASEPGADHEALERLAVFGAIDSLSERDREALMLTVWDGLTHAQSADVMGCSITAFAVRHHRARRRLEAALIAQEAGHVVSTVRIGKDAK